MKECRWAQIEIYTRGCFALMRPQDCFAVAFGNRRSEGSVDLLKRLTLFEMNPCEHHQIEPHLRGPAPIGSCVMLARWKDY